MLNIHNTVLLMLVTGGKGILLNKEHLNNFVFLLSTLAVWLQAYVLMISKSKSKMTFLYVILLSAVLLALKTKNMLIFYMSYEFTVIPITMILFFYGYQPEKLQASIFLILYTVAGSLPLLLNIVINCNVYTNISAISVTIGFLVKTPMYLLHMWLPKAHVEAPVGGSMVLAGVLLKLGSYGLLMFLPLIKLPYSLPFYFSLSLMGSLICALVCLRQGDTKLLIAYSSVVHMGIVTMGFISGSETGYMCGFVMVLAHGLCSPFLFSTAFCLYENSHSRLIINNPRSQPIITALLGGLILLNMGVPPSINIWSEVLMSISVLSFMSMSWILMIPVFMFGAVYNLYFYVMLFHTKFGPVLNKYPMASIYPVFQVFFISYMSFFCLDLFHI